METDYYETTGGSRGGLGSFGLIFIMLMLGAITFGVLNITTDFKPSDHSRTSHPEQFSEIDRCFNGGGSISPTQLLKNGRWGEYCQTKDSFGRTKTYWRIFDCERVNGVKTGSIILVTQYKQSGLKKFLKYLNRCVSCEAPISC